MVKHLSGWHTSCCQSKPWRNWKYTLIEWALIGICCLPNQVQCWLSCTNLQPAPSTVSLQSSVPNLEVTWNHRVPGRHAYIIQISVICCFPDWLIFMLTLDNRQIPSIIDLERLSEKNSCVSEIWIICTHLPTVGLFVTLKYLFLHENPLEPNRQGYGSCLIFELNCWRHAECCRCRGCTANTERAHIWFNQLLCTVICFCLFFFV